MQPPHPPSDSKDDRLNPMREIDVASLIGSGREVVLIHRGERYRLRVTANGKLILTK
ncbi:hemin uptake protein HemP [Microvirga guangxiensis]|uniref:Hemin uptake protein HemP n=1 Tax=Microvirga guangxiensis TaxID=549386 RepID=A0A1G5G7W1_9HYPH|nr:hemin uptake protein HemP [Microvirga guangxiensis]SCY47642.1 Hemin uptake protein HemP [Microvirga guangxiensis]